MGTVHTDNERAHVRGGTGARGENEISLEALAVEHIGIEKVARAFDDALFRQQDDVERHEQAGCGNEWAAERDADRAGAGDGGESFGDADVGSGELIVVRFRDDAGQAAKSIDERNRKKFGLGENDALRFAGCEGHNVAECDWSSLDSPDHGGGFGGVLLKGRGEIDHLQWEILCKDRAGKSISGRVRGFDARARLNDGGCDGGEIVRTWGAAVLRPYTTAQASNAAAWT